MCSPARPAQSALLVLAICALGLDTPAQLAGGQWNEAWRFDGSRSAGQSGSAVANAGDVNGDGYSDIIVGAWLDDLHGSGSGAARVYSGLDGSLIWQMQGAGADDNFGWCVCGVGDMNHDGLDDFAVGAPAAPGFLATGATYVFSGANASLLWQFDGVIPGDRLGYSIAGIGDFDADGTDDIVVGAPNFITTPRPGYANVYSGATGQLLFQFVGNQSDSLFGFSVAGVGDLDQDGHADVAVGDPSWGDPFFNRHGGLTSVFSGLTGSEIHTFVGQSAYSYFGASLDGAGDIDGDGINDLIVGAEGTLVSGQAGSAYLFSGASGSEIHRFDGEATGDDFGISVAGAGDADGDGTPDVLIGAPNYNAGSPSYSGAAYLYSGATTQLIRRFDGDSDFMSMGSAVAGNGDIDGNRLADFIVGAKTAAPNGLFWAGSTFVYSLDPFLELSHGKISVGLGETVGLDIAFPASEAGTSYAILASLSGIGPTVINGLTIPLTSDFLLARMMSSRPTPGLIGGRGILDNAATATASLTAGPALVAIIGRTLKLAAVTFDQISLLGRLSSAPRYLRVEA